MKGQYLSPPVDDRLIWETWLSSHNLPAMLAADEISLFDKLADGPLSVQDAATVCNVNPRALGIISGLLCALGFLNRRDGRLGLTVTSRNYLVKSSNFYWGALLGFWRDRLPAYDQFIEALAPDAQHKGGDHAKGWEAGNIPLEQAIGIAAFMHAHSCAPAIGAAKSGAYKGVKRLLDVGAGSGVFSVAAAQVWPELRATVMDLDTMCQAAKKYIDEGEVADRVDTAAVDMFREPWPTGYDALFFSNIFHDWNDEVCVDLAKKAFDVLPSGGRIFLHEQLMNDNLDGPAVTASFSVLMLIGTQGKQYSLQEFEAILGKAGFVDVEATATCGYYSLVSARKP
ncbi:MAG: methyltransferase [Sphingobium sp.]|nr:methyltransferase [Sphingobium sp.]